MLISQAIANKIHFLVWILGCTVQLLTPVPPHWLHDLAEWTENEEMPLVQSSANGPAPNSFCPVTAFVHQSGNFCALTFAETERD